MVVERAAHEDGSNEMGGVHTAARERREKGEEWDVKREIRIGKRGAGWDEQG